jgi:hypothetical protein
MIGEKKEYEPLSRKAFIKKMYSREKNKWWSIKKQ